MPALSTCRIEGVATRSTGVEEARLIAVDSADRVVDTAGFHFTDEWYDFDNVSP